MGDHDHSYKLLFAHPQLVQDLLEGFVGGEWLDAVDFATLERVSESHVSDDLRGRADDIVWRVRCGQHHIYFLIEFQSSVEPFMAVRVLTYVGLLYQDLLRAKEIEQNGGLLPAVLPIVLHNGRTRWRAANELALLLREAPRELQEYGANMRFLLVDEGSYDDGILASRKNLVAMMFRLENCRERGRAGELVNELAEVLQGSEHDSLRRAFAVWLDRVVLARLIPGRTVAPNTLWEIRTMLAETVDGWVEELKQEGAAKLLTRMLQTRFGGVPDAVHARVGQAPRDQVGRWGERMLSARTLDDIFEEEWAGTTVSEERQGGA